MRGRESSGAASLPTPAPLSWRSSGAPRTLGVASFATTSTSVRACEGYGRRMRNAGKDAFPVASYRNATLFSPDRSPARCRPTLIRGTFSVVLTFSVIDAKIARILLRTAAGCRLDPSHETRTTCPKAMLKPKRCSPSDRTHWNPTRRPNPRFTLGAPLGLQSLQPLRRSVGLESACSTSRALFSWRRFLHR